jgi:hypothetical protein
LTHELQVLRIFPLVSFHGHHVLVSVRFLISCILGLGFLGRGLAWALGQNDGSWTPLPTKLVRNIHLPNLLLKPLVVVHGVPSADQRGLPCQGPIPLLFLHELVQSRSRVFQVLWVNALLLACFLLQGQLWELVLGGRRNLSILQNGRHLLRVQTGLVVLPLRVVPDPAHLGRIFRDVQIELVLLQCLV